MALSAVVRPKVLLVELHNDSRPLGVILERADHDVWTADSLEAAVHVVLSQLELDLVIIDTMLPTETGLLVCAAVHEQSGDSIPIVVLSSAADGQTLVAAFTAGAVDYLHKPIERCELLARIGKHIERARHVRALTRENQALHEQNAALNGQLERHRTEEPAAVSPPLTLNLNAVKEQLIAHALQQTQGNITAAARILGVHRSWFYRRKT